MVKKQDWMSEEFLEFIQVTETLSKEISESEVSKYVGNIITVEDINNGESSAVYKITGERGICILKFVRYPESLSREVNSLDLWRNSGVKTPLILSSNLNNKPPYAIMEYIEDPLLSSLELSKDEFLKALGNLGSTMKKMHSIPADGFGATKIENGLVIAEQHDLKTYLQNLVASRIKILSENNLWNDQLQVVLDDAVKLIIATPSLNPVLIHDDLLPYNCFYNIDSKEITVFDPHAASDLAIMDIGRTLFKLKFEHGDAAAEAFLKGYGDSIDKNLINCGLIIRGVLQLSYRVSKKRMEGLEKGFNIILQSAV